MNVLIFTDVNETMGFGRYAGAYRIASELRMAGFSVLVIDFFADLELNQLQKIADLYIDKDTLWAGFATTLFQSRPDSLGDNGLGDHEDKLTARCDYFPRNRLWMSEMFSILRRRNPNLKIVVGGGRATLPPHDYEGVDYWVWGEADRSALELTRHLNKETTSLKARSAASGQIIGSNTYPYLDFSHSKILWRPEDHIFPGEHLPIEIARGCAFNCSFCSHSKKRLGEGEKDDIQLRDELIQNFEMYGTTGYMFCDDTYNDSIRKVERLHKVFTSLPFQIEWSSFARIDIIHKYPQMRDLLLESGMRSVQFGIETFHPQAAKKIGKPLHPDKIKELLYFLKETWNERIIITSGFIVGLPGEPADSILETFDWLMADDCPLDSFYLFALNIKSPSSYEDDGIDYSKFSVNPENFGYKKVEGLGWENEHMTYEEAKILAEELRQLRNQSGRNQKPGFTFYSRLRNLGFTFEELYFFSEHFKDVKEFDLRHDQAKSKLRDQYFEKILNANTHQFQSSMSIR